MDSTVLAGIVSAVAGVLGSAVGGAAAVWGSARTSRHQLELQREQNAVAYDDRRIQRQQEAFAGLLTAVAGVTAAWGGVLDLATYNSPDISEIKTRYDALHPVWESYLAAYPLAELQWPGDVQSSLPSLRQAMKDLDDAGTVIVTGVINGTVSGGTVDFTDYRRKLDVLNGARDQALEEMRTALSRHQLPGVVGSPALPR